MISNLIILIYAFNSCCLTYFITVLDYCKYSCIVYNMEVVSIEKKINHLIFFSPLMTNDKFLTLPLLTSLKKNPGAATACGTCSLMSLSPNVSQVNHLVMSYCLKHVSVLHTKIEKELRQSKDI